MCDYSLHHVASRPAKVSDKLVTTELAKSSSRGFAAVGELGAKLVIHDTPPKVAVCLLPGTELAFDEDVQYDRGFLGKARVKHKVARFREIEMTDPDIHYDALEFPDGQVLKLRQLVAGQTATVLQLPVAIEHHAHVEPGRFARSESRIALNRGTASILMPNQGAVMLWQGLRSAATRFSTTAAQSFRRLKARKQPVVVDTEFQASFDKDLLAATLPTKRSAQKPEKPVEAQAAV